MTSPPLEELMTLTAALTPARIISDMPLGTRVVVDIVSGTFAGPDLRGTLESSGGDWVTIARDGSVRLDVRLILKTDDGVAILMTYRGVAFETTDGTRIAHVAPLFEAPSGRYDWLNGVQAIGIGQPEGDSVRYRLYRLHR